MGKIKCKLTVKQKVLQPLRIACKIIFKKQDIKLFPKSSISSSFKPSTKAYLPNLSLSLKPLHIHIYTYRYRETYRQTEN